MAYPDKLLTRGERVVLNKHPHWKALILPVLFFIVIIAGGFVLAAVIKNWNHHTIGWIVIAVVGVILLILLVLVPVIQWRTEHFVVTSSHVFFRKGIVKRREHQIPLAYIQNIDTHVSVWGRILGYGSLIVESGADNPLEFQNVAGIIGVQSTLNQLIADQRQGYGNAEPPMAPPPQPPR